MRCTADRVAHIDPERRPISRKCETGRKSEIDLMESDVSGHKKHFTAQQREMHFLFGDGSASPKRYL